MAKIRKRTSPVRADPEFKKIIDAVIAKNLLKGRRIASSRVTLAMKRQYDKYPNLKIELEESELK